MIYYTDGGARPSNPGPGGYGVAVFTNEGELFDTICSVEKRITTNNEQELLALLYAVRDAIKRDEPCTIFADSAYALNCVTTWAPSWEKNGWRRPKNKEIINLPIIKEIYHLLNENGSHITLKKVDGHSNILGNELADALSRNNEKDINRLIKEIKDGE